MILSEHVLWLFYSGLMKKVLPPSRFMLSELGKEPVRELLRVLETGADFHGKKFRVPTNRRQSYMQTAYWQDLRRPTMQNLYLTFWFVCVRHHCLSRHPLHRANTLLHMC